MIKWQFQALAIQIVSEKKKRKLSEFSKEKTICCFKNTLRLTRKQLVSQNGSPALFWGALGFFSFGVLSSDTIVFNIKENNCHFGASETLKN